MPHGDLHGIPKINHKASICICFNLEDFFALVSLGDFLWPIPANCHSKKSHQPAPTSPNPKVLELLVCLLVRPICVCIFRFLCAIRIVRWLKVPEVVWVRIFPFRKYLCVRGTDDDNIERAASVSQERRCQRASLSTSTARQLHSLSLSFSLSLRLSLLP